MKTARLKRKNTPLKNAIQLRGVSENNLRGIDVEIPLSRFTVITGVSGSGKSTLAFDVLYAEGQRRYVSSFSSYTRQFLERLPAPDALSISEIPPAIALRPTGPGRTARSTVGTLTELLDHLQVLFAKASSLHCPKCDTVVEHKTRDSLVSKLIDQFASQRLRLGFVTTLPTAEIDDLVVDGLRMAGFARVIVDGVERPIDGLAGTKLDRPELEVVIDRIKPTPHQRNRVSEAIAVALDKGRGSVRARSETSVVDLRLGLVCDSCQTAYKEPTPARFSFNSAIGACPDCRGFGRAIIIDPDKVIPDSKLSLSMHAIRPLSSPRFRREFREMLQFCEKQKIPTDVPYSSLTKAQKKKIWEGGTPFCGIQALFDWLESKSYKMHVRIQLARYRGYATCETCHGSRLRQEALMYKVGGLDFAEMCALPVSNAQEHLEKSCADMGPALSPVIERIQRRLGYLLDVGLGYLSLDRMARTLSGGEAQRVHLTAALGTSLASTLFVLDEPSVGLHSRDSERLIDVLKNLRDSGNTVVVVEHDPEIIRAADHLIDLGPAAGEFGGELIYQGTPSEIVHEIKSATGIALRGELKDPRPQKRRAPSKSALKVRGATAHNLKNLDLEIPLQALIVVTGRSGSGKSTLVDHVIYSHLARQQGEIVEDIGECDEVCFIGPTTERVTSLLPCIRVDQSPPGRSSRSNPATYVGAWDEVRKIFGERAKAQGLDGGARLFSFNVAGGRCEECKGEGAEIVDMQFLADVRMTCPTCGGKRFTQEVLDVRWNGLNIADVLNMTVSEALDRFELEAKIVRALEPLRDIGLGYLRLGQPTSTLSGGEAQRLKLAKHLVDAAGESALFILDEPTTGLHLADVSILIEALQNVVDRGHSLIVVEHHLDLIMAADWVFDLGPEGGPNGGHIIAQGTPEDIAKNPLSSTGESIVAWQRQRDKS